MWHNRCLHRFPAATAATSAAPRPLPSSESINSNCKIKEISLIQVQIDNAKNYLNYIKRKFKINMFKVNKFIFQNLFEKDIIKKLDDFFFLCYSILL